MSDERNRPSETAPSPHDVVPPDEHDVRAKARECCIRFGLPPEKEDTIIDTFLPLVEEAFYAGLNHAESPLRKAVVRAAEDLEHLVLLDENAHLAAFLNDLRREARAAIDAAPKSKEELRLALIELRDGLDCLDRIERTAGGWGKRRRQDAEWASRPCVGRDCKDGHAGEYFLCPRHLAHVIDTQRRESLCEFEACDREPSKLCECHVIEGYQLDHGITARTPHEMAALRRLADKAIAWRKTPVTDDHNSTAPWVGALMALEKAIDAQALFDATPCASPQRSQTSDSKNE